ncbi:ABC transporter permease [Aquisphaera insulae]|uniref:ABC transporter permease n=1 Tax=Aquisphaera insulae TaxID=2712864 RepID=UPI0013ED5346|nr:ABC transporter permease [Aquisphaera insulae]
MFPGPVFFHELRAAARRRRTFILRTGIGLLLLFLLISFVGQGRYGLHSPYHEYAPRDVANLGFDLFLATVWVEFLLILVLTPAYLAGSIAEERQRKILPYLLASPLGGVEIVCGKFASRLINLVTLLLMCLPILSLSLFLGGVDPLMVWLTAGVGFSSICFVASMSMVVSLYCTLPRDAIIATYAIELAGLYLLAWLNLVIQSGSGWPQANWLHRFDAVGEWIASLSPLNGLMDDLTSGQGWPAALLRSFLAQIAVSVPLLAWATFRLRPRERGPRVGRLRRFLRWRRREGGPLRLGPRPAVGDRPMIWKECSGTLGSSSVPRFALAVFLKVAFAGTLFLILVIACLPAFKEVARHGYGATEPPYASRSLSFVVRSVTTILYVLAGLLSCVSAATGITSERERDTWISLAATPLEGREIIHAKILGTYWRSRFLLSGMLFTWLCGLVCGAVHPLGFVLAALLTGSLLVFPATLGTYFSLRCKTSAGAIAATVGVAVFLNLGYLLCCVPTLHGGPGTASVLAGVSPLFVAFSPFSYQELDELLHGARLVDPGIAVGSILCVIFYGLCSAGLYGISREEFETLVDRPRRQFRHPLESPDPAGIEFLDDLPSSDGVVFTADEPETPPMIEETTRPQDR